MPKPGSVRVLSTVALLIALSGPASAQQLPPAPAPVAVSLTGASTALLVLDVAQQPCGTIPRCTALVPRIGALTEAARRAGALVVYSSADARAMLAPMAQPAFLAGAVPAQGDPVIIGNGQDRFFESPLDKILRARNVTTLVLTGWRINGSLLYTAVGANLRGYTVVVADDATSAGEDYDIAIGRYQLLTQLNANPRNEPLRRSAVTLSRTDLITFR